MTRIFTSTDTPGVRGRLNLKKIDSWERVNVDDLPQVILDLIDLSKYQLPRTDKELSELWLKLKNIYLKNVYKQCKSKKINHIEDVFQDCYEQFNNLLAYYHPFYRTQTLSSKEFSKNDKYRIDHMNNETGEITFYHTYELNQYLNYNMNFKIMDIVFRKYAKSERKHLYARTQIDELVIKKATEVAITTSKIREVKKTVNSQSLFIHDVLVDEISRLIMKDENLTQEQKNIAAAYFVLGFDEQSIEEELQVDRKEIKRIIRDIIYKTRRLKSFQHIKDSYEEAKLRNQL